MPIPTYTPGYPPDGSSLGQTKSTIRNNLDGTFETLNVDHINNNGQPGSQPAGYHTIIHQVTQTNVSTVNNYNQVFSGVPGTLIVNGVTTPNIPSSGDTQLYSLTGAGTLYQLTGVSPGSFGFAWVGGILLQWGTATVASGTSVTFPETFPHACLNVQVTANASSFGIVGTDGYSTSSFTFKYSLIGTVTFAWFAIGY
jgi:Putative tail fiber protein gp53-like, C-terminal